MSDNPTVYLVGAGGHAAEMRDALESHWRRNGDPVPTVAYAVDTAWLDVARDRHGRESVIDVADLVPTKGEVVALAIGASDDRARLWHTLSARGMRLWGVVHVTALGAFPAAGSNAEKNPHRAVYIGAFAYVGPRVFVGDAVHVNRGAQVAHDCTLGNFVTLAPMANLCGGVTVEEGAMIGASAVVLPGRKIGAWATIGAGAVVTRDVPDGATWVGVPARGMA